MTPPAFDIAVEVAGIMLALVIILRTVPLLKSGKNPMAAALFLFALVSVMLSFVYWLTYTWMRPEMRMPFAANEIGEIAWFLLLASSLETVFGERKVSAKKETVFALLFVAASVALWIGWSGEWIQDIICGLAFGYFLCTCVRALKQTDALNKTQWRILSLACGTIILAQTGTFFVSESFKQPLDYFCYALMFASLSWLFVRNLLTAKHNKDTKAYLALSFTVCAFSFSTLYMSSGWFYLAALLICHATLPLMLHALKREVAA